MPCSSHTLHHKVLDKQSPHLYHPLPWPPQPHSAPLATSPFPSTLAPQTTSATSAKPWNAPQNLPPSPAGAESPWASPPSPHPSPPRAKHRPAPGSPSG